jgi:hypothetical protein
VAKAQIEGAVISLGEETAVREDANGVQGFAPRGQAPVLTTPTRWDNLSMVSAISLRGEVAFWLDCRRQRQR